MRRRIFAGLPGGAGRRIAATRGWQFFRAISLELEFSLSFNLFAGDIMLALDKAREVIRTDPASEAARILQSLMQALEANAAFHLGKLYEADLDTFHLCLEIIKGWRLHRYSGLARSCKAEALQKA